MYSVAATQHIINRKNGVAILLNPWLVVSAGSTTVTAEDWTTTRVGTASCLGREIDAEVGGKEIVIASKFSFRIDIASIFAFLPLTVGCVGKGNKFAHEFAKKDEKTSKKLGTLICVESLVAGFEVATGAVVALGGIPVTAVPGAV